MLKPCALALASIAVLAAVIPASPVSAQIISGPAKVIDGDTLDFTGTRVRLIGIDAPETAQSCTRDGQAWACGTEATSTLAAIVNGAQVTCMAQGTDVYGRTLATCETAVFDVGREMVRRGMAIASDNAPGDYAQASAIAQQLKFGLWNAQFQTPAEWRAANPDAFKPTPQERTARADQSGRMERTSATGAMRERRYSDGSGCTIKGNRSIRGDWIYHVPGQKYYRQTRPEQVFCTESEAQAAGYRRSKQ
jgi:endonuclease YncB( thermonuclease family)